MQRALQQLKPQIGPPSAMVERDWVRLTMTFPRKSWRSSACKSKGKIKIAVTAAAPSGEAALLHIGGGDVAFYQHDLPLTKAGEEISIRM
jgi:hypothetical protein